MKVNQYEALYIVSPELSPEDVQKIADRFKEVVEKQGGTVESAGLWENRKLAYEIDDIKEGNYILMHFESNSNVPAELSRQMRNADEVMRHRIFSREETPA